MRKFSSIKTLDPRLLGPLFVLSWAVVGTLLPDLALAGTGGQGELGGAWTTISGLISGFAGRLVAGIGFLCAVVGSVWGFNPKLILGAGGIGITAALAPTFINATVGALI